MDTLNAPYPANPNAQDPADQNQDQVSVGPAPPQGPIQPIPPLVPIQLAPADGMPVPQIIYQNWVGKKPEFSGRQKRMQSPIFLAQEIGWRHTIFQKEKR